MSILSLARVRRIRKKAQEILDGSDKREQRLVRSLVIPLMDERQTMRDQVYGIGIIEQGLRDENERLLMQLHLKDDMIVELESERDWYRYLHRPEAEADTRDEPLTSATVEHE